MPTTVTPDGVAEPQAAAPVVPARDRASQLLVLAALKKQIAELDGDLRASLAADLEVGDNLSGRLPDGAAIGRVGLSKASESWKVTDADALHKWVAARFPDELESRPTVRNSFIGALLAACKADGGWVDPFTAEVVCPPGIELSVGRPTLTVVPAKDAGELIAAALAAGVLNPDGTRRAIEAAPPVVVAEAEPVDEPGTFGDSALDHVCPTCLAVPAAECATPTGRATRPHAARVRLATAVA